MILQAPVQCARLLFILIVRAEQNIAVVNSKTRLLKDLSTEKERQRERRRAELIIKTDKLFLSRPLILSLFIPDNGCSYSREFSKKGSKCLDNFSKNPRFFSFPFFCTSQNNRVYSLDQAAYDIIYCTTGSTQVRQSISRFFTSSCFITYLQAKRILQTLTNSTKLT